MADSGTLELGLQGTPAGGGDVDAAPFTPDHPVPLDHGGQQRGGKGTGQVRDALGPVQAVPDQLTPLAGQRPGVDAEGHSWTLRQVTFHVAGTYYADALGDLASRGVPGPD